MRRRVFFLHILVNSDQFSLAGTGAANIAGDGGKATASTVFNPFGIFVDSVGSVFVSQNGNSLVRKIATDNTISIVAGTGTTGFGGDGGKATSANMNKPKGLWCDTAGNLYIADTLNYRIRVVDVNSKFMSTLAGMAGGGGYTGKWSLQSLVSHP